MFDKDKRNFGEITCKPRLFVPVKELQISKDMLPEQVHAAVFKL